MKKIFKKVVATVAALAFAVAGLVVAPKTAKAAGTTVKVYVELPSDKTADYYKGNVWGGTASVATTATAARPSGWGSGNLPVGDAVSENGKNYAVFTINNADEVEGFQVVGYADGAQNAEYQESAWNSEVVSQSNGKAYFDLTSKKLYKDAAMTDEIAPRPVSDVLSIVGDFADATWSIPGKVMTKNGDTYTVTLQNVPAGTYGYKFLQSAAEYGWTYQIGKDKTFGSNTDNFSLTLDKASDVTFTITVTAVKGGSGLDANQITDVNYVVMSVSVGDDDDDDETPAAGDETPAAGDETPAAGEDTTPADGNTENPSDGNVNAGDSMAVAAAVIAVVAACGIVVVSFKKRRQDA